MVIKISTKHKGVWVCFPEANRMSGLWQHWTEIQCEWAERCQWDQCSTIPCQSCSVLKWEVKPVHHTRRLSSFFFIYLIFYLTSFYFLSSLSPFLSFNFFFFFNKRLSHFRPSTTHSVLFDGRLAPLRSTTRWFGRTLVPRQEIDALSSNDTQDFEKKIFHELLAVKIENPIDVLPQYPINSPRRPVARSHKPDRPPRLYIRPRCSFGRSAE